MEKLFPYVPPVSETIVLQGRECILELSNYGQNNEPGQGFDPGSIIGGGSF